jgi:predicted Zn-dependent protease
MRRREPARMPRTALAALVASALVGLFPAHAEAQLLDRLRGAADKAQQVADQYGDAVIPISTEQEVTIGRGIAAVVAGRYQVARDEDLADYVNLVGSTLASVAPRDGVAYRFAVLDTDEVNAFAAPGGYIFVTRGALALMEDEAMLAGVLAHEIGHVDERDVVAEIQSKARTTLGIREAADRVDLAGEEYLRKAVETGTGALFMGLSREDELAADAFAIRRTAAVGYDPAGIRRFVAELESREGDEHVSLLEKTHPDPDERLKEIDAALRSLRRPAGEGVVAPERFRRHVPRD